MRAAAWAALVSILGAPGGDAGRALRKRMKEIRTLERREHSVLGRIEAADRAAAELQEDLARVESQEREARSEAATLERSLTDEEARAGERRRAATRRIRELHELGRGGMLKMLFSAGSFADLARRTNLLGRILEADRRTLAEYQEDIRTKQRRTKELERLQGSLDAMQGDVRAGLDAIAEQRRQKVAFLDRVRQERRLAEEALAEMRASEERVERTVLGGPSTEGAGGGFEALRGRLPLPVVGRAVGRFGPREDPRTRTTVVYKGIDLAAPAQASVRAVAEGRVLFADWVRGYGRLLILDHGGRYYTLYAHLGQFSRGVGESVHPGDLLGTVGETGSTSGPLLHFEIRHGDRALDPEGWLARGGGPPNDPTVASGDSLR